MFSTIHKAIYSVLQKRVLFLDVYIFMYLPILKLNRMVLVVVVKKVLFTLYSFVAIVYMIGWVGVKKNIFFNTLIFLASNKNKIVCLTECIYRLLYMMLLRGYVRIYERYAHFFPRFKNTIRVYISYIEIFFSTPYIHTYDMKFF